ncbi:hypothetical protein BV20DRAFT_628366 [Pilatotrama ljubarskyi]|nr:hypothetical protein BV20DRAFT_628366 [Pilatotrama ljubarskyi]
MLSELEAWDGAAELGSPTLLSRRCFGCRTDPVQRCLCCRLTSWPPGRDSASPCGAPPSVPTAKLTCVARKVSGCARPASTE